MLELEGFVGHVNVLIWKKGGVYHKGTLGKVSYCLSGLVMYTTHEKPCNLYIQETC